jgi:hypothetical protein
VRLKTSCHELILQGRTAPTIRVLPVIANVRKAIGVYRSPHSVMEVTIVGTTPTRIRATAAAKRDSLPAPTNTVCLTGELCGGVITIRHLRKNCCTASFSILLRILSWLSAAIYCYSLLPSWSHIGSARGCGRSGVGSGKRNSILLLVSNHTTSTLCTINGRS